MCSSYWTVTADVTCPNCGVRAPWGLQTHDYGEVGSCINFYREGEPVGELGGVANGTFLSFTGACPECGVWQVNIVGEVWQGAVRGPLFAAKGGEAREGKPN